MQSPPYTTLFGAQRAEELQSAWAYRYKDLMNQKAFRDKIIKHGSARLSFYEYHVNKRGKLTSPPFGVIGLRGTIVEHSPDVEPHPGEPRLDVGHYMSYFRSGDVVTIYDPAPLEGTFGRNRQRLFNVLFPRYTVNIPHYKHQIHADDTWCQTWSAAFNDNSMQADLVPMEFDELQSQQVMHRFVDMFVDRMHEDNDILPLGTRAEAEAVYQDYRQFGFRSFRRFGFFYKDREV